MPNIKLIALCLLWWVLLFLVLCTAIKNCGAVDRTPPTWQSDHVTPTA